MAGNYREKETGEVSKSPRTAAVRAAATGMAIANAYCVVDRTCVTVDARQLADLVMRMQQAFLDVPDLAMTVAEACTRFDVDECACEAVLDLLAEAKVLAKRSDGAYMRVVRERASIHHVTSRRRPLLPLPRSVAFITPGELARLTEQARRVA
jgi:hypothetical protein